MSDELIEVPGGINSNNYANIQVITNVAIRTNCDAVWPVKFVLFFFFMKHCM